MTPDLHERRRALALDEARTLGHDAVVVSSPANVRYLCGFTGSSGLLLLTREASILVTDFRYREQSELETGRSVRIDIVKRDPWAEVFGHCEKSGVQQAAFESDTVAESLAVRLRARRKVKFRGARDIVAGLRTVKDPSEVEKIRGAAALAEAALAEIVPLIKPGVQEIVLAAELERELRIRGSERHPFETIVASGPRSALPHARTTDREFKLGEFVLIDFGATYQGYCSDLTRTFVVGQADERQKMVYGLVRDAQSRALKGLKAGITGAEGDMLARGLIEEHGFGDAFGHSLGHGLGLDVHEEPRVSSANDRPLPEGCVVTVEPGLYFPGWGGVRIEDDVHLTATGADLLTQGSTELVELA
jgi:Xaa-Pro aminopeptidase